MPRKWHVWLCAHAKSDLRSVVISQTHWLVSQERLSQSRHLVSGGSKFYSWCVTPHSSPSSGCWQHLTIFNILNIFTIINQIENRHIIAQYHCLLASACIPPPPPMGVSHDHMTRVFPSLLRNHGCGGSQSLLIFAARNYTEDYH